MRTAPILAHNPSHLTTVWAQSIVNQHHADAQVSDVQILEIDIGTTTRVRIAVNHNGAENLPRRWFVKLPSQVWRARLITALPRLLHTEVRFYNEIAKHTSLTLTPCLAAHSRFGQGSTLVLADVGEFSYTPGRPDDALNFTQASEVIKQLAQFHARFWQHPQLDSRYSWLAGSVRKLEDILGAALAAPLMERGLRLAENLVSPELHAPALRYAKQRRKIMAFLNDAPQTLIHHDCHAGNLFWQENKVGFLDWQLVRLGEGVSDVAYFLATALSPEIRRQHEKNLLCLYADTLCEHGITSISQESLMPRYRAHCCYAFEAMLVTLAVGGMMNLSCNLELIRRTAAAVQELNAFCALP